MQKINSAMGSLPTPLPAGKRDGSPAKTYECDTCKDETGYLVEVEGRQIWRVCSCVEQRKLRRLMKSSHMSSEMQTNGFKTFCTDGRPDCVVHARNCALDYLENFDQNKPTRQNSIALLGTPGTGKTHLLAAIANNLIKRGVGVLYFPHVQGFEDLKSNFDETEAKKLAMKKADVLWWDDLYKGRRAPTDYQLEAIFEVINERYLNNKPIMISSERDIDELCAIDQGIGSRIYEMTKNHTVILKPSEGIGIKDLNYRLRGV